MTAPKGFGFDCIQHYYQVYLTTRQKMGLRGHHIKCPQLFYASILCIGIIARVWMFGSNPPGLNQDEASIGIDAYSLWRYRVDRNGVSFPVLFVSWGSGQNALYGYLMIPFIAVGGLSPITVRLPMLISGILTLPLVYYVGFRLSGPVFGLLSMWFMAISPWHILLSRWGLESNILPFVFLLGFVCLLKSSRTKHWFVGACVCFAASVYAYGTAYVVVPVMVFGSSVILLAAGRVRWRVVVWGWLILIVLAAPIIAFIVINSNKLDSVFLGPITIPRLPSQPRHEAISILYHANWHTEITGNLVYAVEMLWSQTDHNNWNVIDPYGYFYGYTFPLAVLGLVGLIPASGDKFRIEKLLFFTWVLACLPVFALQQVNINRMNIVFIPLIMSMSYPAVAVVNRFRKLFLLLAGCLFLVFGFWLHALDSQRFLSESRVAFSDGLLPALDFARNTPSVPICVSDSPNMPYIYALFVEKMRPGEFLDRVHYDDPRAPFRKVRSFGRYYFGLSDCPNTTDSVFVLLSGESPPSHLGVYSVSEFGLFRVHWP